MGRWLICYVQIHKIRNGKKLTSGHTDRYEDTPLFIQSVFFLLQAYCFGVSICFYSRCGRLYNRAALLFRLPAFISASLLFLSEVWASCCVV